MADDESKRDGVDEPEAEAADGAAAEEPQAEETPAPERQAEEPAAAEPQAEAAAATEPQADEPAAAEPEAEEVVVEGDRVETHEDLEEEIEDEPTPRVKPEIPGMELEPDIVREGEEALRHDEEGYDDELSAEEAEEILPQPIADAAIDLAAGARYRATGKRKTAVARVILLPGNGTYTINGRSLEVYFPREGLQRQIRQALETVGLEAKMDVVAKMHGGGVSAQAGALRHGISRALVDADPHLRGELKRRGFLTRDSRVKERKKAGLKKARKRPQFSKR
jgi:small subunit ribosomal protein S9